MGIVIDPGSNFVENFYRLGFSLEEIDLIIITHDHIDHLSDLDPLLSLIDYRNLLGDEKFKDRELIILGNRSIMNRYRFFNRSKKDNIKVFEFGRVSEVVRHFNPSYNFQIYARPADHPDCALKNSYGLQIKVGGEHGPSLGITSDTKMMATKAWQKILNSDVLVAHLSSVPMTQLFKLSGLSIGNQDNKWLQKIWDDIIEKQTTLHRQINFALWLKGKSTEASPFKEISEDFKPPGSHLYLEGILEYARLFLRKRKGKKGLFIVSELREELGSFRNKIAESLNYHIFEPEVKKVHQALTADHGLEVIIDKISEGENKIQVLCSTCDLDNDTASEERYHDPLDIKEVCIKGEDEGIFYNCLRHDPGTQLDPMFVERMERYDVFGRPLSRG